MTLLEYIEKTGYTKSYIATQAGVSIITIKSALINKCSGSEKLQNWCIENDIKLEARNHTPIKSATTDNVNENDTWISYVGRVIAKGATEIRVYEQERFDLLVNYLAEQGLIYETSELPNGIQVKIIRGGLGD